MKKYKFIIILLISCLVVFLTSGCWNYREIDKMGIVAGVAIDKGTTKRYCITVEIVKTSGGQDSKTTSSLLSMEGDTIFDSARNIISISGRRLYWSHSKIVIISEELAREGVIDVIDWYSRDAETRADVHVLVSRESSARKILEGKTTSENVKSFEIDDILAGEKSLSKAPKPEIWQFSNDLAGEGISATAPTIMIDKENKGDAPFVMGTAIFKKDKLVGYLNGEETKELLFIKNKIKGGVLIFEKQGAAPVALEIFKNKTKITPLVSGEDIAMNVNAETLVAIDEIESNINYIEDAGRKKLESECEKMQNKRMLELIKKVQTKYDVDIFGFGAKLREDNPKIWKRIGSNWNEIFKNMNVNVSSKIHIRNSAMLSKPLKTGE